MGIATGAALAIGGMGAASSYMSSRNARKAQNSQNAANAAISKQANEMEMARYYQSRGAAMGASYEELMAKPGDSNYDPNLSLFDQDGSAKQSAILPLYLSEMEKSLSGNISDKYGALAESYDPERMQNIQQQLAGAEQGMIDVVNNVYNGNELATTNSYLDSIQGQRERGLDGVIDARARGLDGTVDARLAGSEDLQSARLRGLDEVQQARLSASQAEAQAILNEGQRNAANQNFTGRSGIVGNSGNAQASTLAALMGAYTDAGVNAADNRLLNAKDASTVYDKNAADRNRVGILNATDTARNLEMNAVDKTRIAEQGEADKFKSYLDNLGNQKNFQQVAGALGTIANNQNAVNASVFAPEMAASKALNAGGFQLGQGRTPEVNVPSYTAPVKSNPFQHINAGIQSGISGYMLANALSTPTTTPTPGGVASVPDYTYADMTGGMGGYGQFSYE
tara:strand:+ start:10329 stop:11690 length:1362 start_codon:yes stop_codon:yes gene_type:complete